MELLNNAKEEAITGEIVDEETTVYDEKNDSALAELEEEYRHLMSQLNQQQQRFIQEYVRTGKAEKSALSAGYSIKSARSCASRNLQKPTCQKIILLATDITVRRNGIPKSYIRDKLITVADICSDTSGDHFNGMNVVRAVAEIAKIEGHLAPTVNKNLNVDVQLSFNLDIPSKK